MIRDRQQLHDNRKRNLESLVLEMGGGSGAVKLLAKKTGCNSEYLHQILRGTTRHDSNRPRTMGAEMAARIERALGKPQGWMDQPHHLIGGTWREVVCGLPDEFGDRLVKLAKGLRDGTITPEQFDAAVTLLVPAARITANSPTTPLLPFMANDE